MDEALFLADRVGIAQRFGDGGIGFSDSVQMGTVFQKNVRKHEGDEAPELLPGVRRKRSSAAPSPRGRQHRCPRPRLIVVVVQFVLLLVSVESFLGASGLCFAGATWLIRYILPLSSKRPGRPPR